MTGGKEDKPGAHTLIIEQVGEVAVVATTPDEAGVRVIATLDCRNPRAPRVVEVLVSARQLNRKALRALIPSISEVMDLPTVKAATVRGISVNMFEEKAQAEVDDYQSLVGDVHSLAHWGMTHGWGAGMLRLDGYEFRLDRDQAAAIRKVVGAWLYVNEVSGVDHLAAWLNVTDSAAKNLLQQARKAGYLTPGTPGKQGGEMTEEGVALLLAAITAYQAYEKGLQ